MTSRVALVTGGTGGIGTAIVKRLADMGHKVATNYRSEERARPWADKMKAEGYDVLLVKGDVTLTFDTWLDENPAAVIACLAQILAS